MSDSGKQLYVLKKEIFIMPQRLDLDACEKDDDVFKVYPTESPINSALYYAVLDDEDDEPVWTAMSYDDDDGLLIMSSCPPDENSAGAKKLKKKLEKLVDDPKRREVMFKVFLRAASNDSIDSILEDAYAEVYGQGYENECFEDTHAEIEAETAGSWNLDTFIAVYEGRQCVYLDEDSPIIKPAAKGSEARRVDIKKLLREEEESDDWEDWEFLDDAEGVAYCVMPAE